MQPVRPISTFYAPARHHGDLMLKTLSESPVLLLRHAYFPLYEIAEGHYNITVEDKAPRTVADYVRRQDRFSTWKKNQVAALQQQIDGAYAQLKNNAAHEMN